MSFVLLLGLLVFPSPASAEVFDTITTPGDGWDVTFHPTNQNYGFFVGHHEIGELGGFYRVDPDGAETGKAQGDGCFDGGYTLSLGTDKVGMKSSVWVTSDGDIVLTSDGHRSRQRNVETVRERLRDAILAALKPPKRRKKTRPSRSSVKRRLDRKKARGKVKRDRRRPREED